MSFKIPDTPEELFRQGRKGFDRFGRWLPFLAVLIIILGVFLSSFYSIDTDEVGVIRRFGKYARTVEPGLHWKLPFGIERMDAVKVRRVFKEEFGYRTVNPGVRMQYSSRGYKDESLMLTGDLNVIEVTWIVQYRISDPEKFLFNIFEPRQTVRDVSEAVMRQTVGNSSVSEALTTRRLEINLTVQKKMQEILDHYQSGIRIDTVKLQDVNPPDEVKASFNAVNEAKQEKEKMINEARQVYNRIIPRATGEAEKTIREAEGYALRRINEAKGDAEKFTQIWSAYKEARDVTRRRMYLEALADILPKAGPVYIMDQQGHNLLPLLDLKSLSGTKNE